jgi:hypothetical protein
MTNSTRFGRARQGQVAPGRRAITGRRASTNTTFRARLSKARRKFLRAFPGGFRDQDYLEWERNYKWRAHLEWQKALTPDLFEELIKRGEHRRIAKAAIGIESRTNLLFSFEKIALRDAVSSEAAAKKFALGLYGFLHGPQPLEERFEAWVQALGGLPRRQTRVLTWPAVTVFGFLARPGGHFFFKPTVTREAARRLGVDLPYAPKPSWPVYKTLLNFVKSVRAEIKTLHPRDMIDLQSFLWVQGSEEYPD